MGLSITYYVDPPSGGPPPLCSDAGLKRFLGENAGLKENKRFWGENAGLKVQSVGSEQLIRGTLFVDISKEIV